MEAIALERELLKDLRDKAHVIDTSQTSAAGLRTQIKTAHRSRQPRKWSAVDVRVVCFQQGIPMDADFVFDVRMLPNPHYEPHAACTDGVGSGCHRVSPCATGGRSDASADL